MASIPLRCCVGCLTSRNVLDRCNYARRCKRNFRSTSWMQTKTKMDHEAKEDDKKLAVIDAKEVLRKEFPSYFDANNTRISYVDFMDQALAKLKELGLERDINAYKEILRVLPPGRYHPDSIFDFGMFHAPQQLAAARVLQQMEKNRVRPDKDFEKIVIAAFTKRSDVWLKIARLNYWSMKGRNVDPHPLPENLPKEPHQLAKIAISRMLDDPKSLMIVKNTHSLPNAIDKTWVVFTQSPTQSAIIENLDEKSTLYLEESGLSYVDDKFLSYFTLKYYVDEKTREQKSKALEPDFNYNTMKVKFYGKPIQEKLLEPESHYYTDGYYTLSIGMTGTSSQDSLLSWLKFLQQRNPKLNKLNVVFKMSRPTPELIEVSNSVSSG